MHARACLLVAAAACTLVSTPATAFSNFTLGPWVRTVDPVGPGDAAGGRSWYLNDHSFVYGPNGTWHVLAIQLTQPPPPGDVDDEAPSLAARVAAAAAHGSNPLTGPPRMLAELGTAGFAHATVAGAENVAAPAPAWRQWPFAMGTAFPETHLWAPHILWNEDAQLYFMFYCGGGVDRTRSMIRLATSRDLFHWERRGTLFDAGVDGRDPMVLDRGRDFPDPSRRYVIYYCGTNPDNHGREAMPVNTSHVDYARTSPDLLHWGPETVVFERGNDFHNYGGPTESPFVVQRGDDYYLFNGPYDDYTILHTRVWHSKDPLDFGSIPKGTATLVRKVSTHAAEVVRTPAGRWYVSKCGPGQGGLYLAELTWALPANPADGRTSPPPPPLLPAAGSVNGGFVGNVDPPGSPGAAGWVSTRVDCGGAQTWGLTPSGIAVGCPFGVERISFNAPAAPAPLTEPRAHWEVSFALLTADGNPEYDRTSPRAAYGSGALIFFENDATSVFSGTGFYVNVSLDSHQASLAAPTPLVSLHRLDNKSAGPVAGPTALPSGAQMAQGEPVTVTVDVACATLGGSVITVSIRGTVVATAAAAAGDSGLQVLNCGGGGQAATAAVRAGVGVWQGSALFRSFVHQRNPRYT